MSESVMRAVVARAWGEADVLAEAEVERPRPGPTEVLVRVRAAGVNPADWQTRADGGFGDWGTTPPVLGYDVSGTVEEVGLGVLLHQQGDEVFGMLPFPWKAGGYAEFVAAPARCFVPKPDSLDHTEAAALPLAGLTAWQALNDVAGLSPGHRVLVHAAAGGVGHLAVQIAKSRGAHVAATARTENHGFLRALGVDELVDYRRTDFASVLRDMDVVLDTVGGDYGMRSLEVLRDGGRLVSLAAEVEDIPYEAAAKRDIHAGLMLVEPDHAGLRAIADLAATRQLRPEIGAMFPLSAAAQAHAFGEHGGYRGKIVLTLG